MFHAGRALVATGLLAILTTTGAAQAQGISAPGPEGESIVNGIPTNLQPTTGALLFTGPDFKNQFLDCSGVLIGCRTVLTAAHCMCESATNYAECIAEVGDHECDWRFYFQHSGLHHVRDVYIHPDYVPGVGADLAIVRLSEIVTGVEPARFHQGYPPNILHGTDGIVTGFGSTSDTRLDAGIKRVGSVVTAECAHDDNIAEPANICWNFTAPILKPGDEVNLCLADDGGPLFVDFGNGPEVTGIHAGRDVTCDEDSYSYDTNVRHNADWVKAVGGLDVTRDQCSDLGEVGEPWVLVQGGTGRLPKTQTEKLFSFNIPKETLVLRVTVNGDTEKSGDYDLFVGLDSKVPTRDDNDCQARGTGQFAACAFDEPDATKVNVVIRHVRPDIGRGKSRFQVTVTAFQEVPPYDPPPRGPDNLRYTKRSPGFRTLTWFDDSSNEKGFEIQRRAGTDPVNPFSTRATINVANRQSYIESIPDTSTFTYRVRAFNDFGDSEWSNLCVVNHPRISRPTRLRAEAVTAERVTLRWRDNTTEESAMEVQRRLSGAIKWKTIGVPPANTRDFVDRNVDPGQNYEYRVRARGFLEECIAHSRYSAILEVSTPVP